MNNKNILIAFIIIIILGFMAYILYFAKQNTVPINVNTPNTSTNNSGTSSPIIILPTTLVYNNRDYGFDFTLPISWQGYSVVKTVWKGTPLTNTSTQSGPKILIRNPKWTESKPYEDMPVLVFTSAQWASYQKENFFISAAPIKASELGANNKYIFALPARWDFDYSEGYKEAQYIIKGNPLRAFNITSTDKPQTKLNTDMICEQVTSYMRFADAKSRDAFITDCKEGKHPEVIEKYKTDMHIGDGAQI
jgi:hypothetical protein